MSQSKERRGFKLTLIIEGMRQLVTHHYPDATKVQCSESQTHVQTGLQGPDKLSGIKLNIDIKKIRLKSTRNEPKQVTDWINFNRLKVRKEMCPTN